MEKVIKYQAFDGKLFDDDVECSVHEHKIKEFLEIQNRLSPKINDCNFSNGEGYIQHDISNFIDTKQKFVQYINFNSNHAYKSFDQLGRYLDDSNALFYSFWYRLACIDDLGREWGQIYYKNNPDKAKQIEYKSQTGMLYE